MTSFVVSDDLAGIRIDVALAAHLGSSRSHVAGRILAGEVLVDGEPSNKRHRLRVGETVELVERERPQRPPPPVLPPIRYRDEHLLVVAKPAGLVVHPGAGHPDDTLVDALLGAGIELAPAGGDGRPGIVHRLDRDTSGLLVVACTDVAHRGLVTALQRRSVARRYLALVRGTPTATRGRIDAPIGRHPGERTRFAVVEDGKPAVTRYRVLATGRAPDLLEHRAEVSLLICELETGRTHQIRVHLTALGHPIVGDPTYGAAGDVAAALRLRRPFLHAASLAFDHPVTGEWIALDEPLPEELEAGLGRAGLGVPADIGLHPAAGADDAG